MCDVFGKPFTSKVKLADHKRKHIKRYKCDICGKTFARKDNLTNHKRTHTEERPFIYVIFVISPTLAVGT